MKIRTKAACNVYLIGGQFTSVGWFRTAPSFNWLESCQLDLVSDAFRGWHHTDSGSAVAAAVYADFRCSSAAEAHPFAQSTAYIPEYDPGRTPRIRRRSFRIRWRV